METAGAVVIAIALGVLIGLLINTKKQVLAELREIRAELKRQAAG